MKNNEWQEELLELKKLKENVKQSLKNAPIGKMRSEMAQGKYPQYYVIREDEKAKYPHGRYLPKSEIQVAVAYAQKEYDQLILEEIIRREKAIEKCSALDGDKTIRSLHLKLAPAKRCLVKTYELSDDEYVENWEKMNHEKEIGYPIVNGFDTERGELVRSKSEKIIADKLFRMNIPYKYEAGLQMDKNGIIYPDFTVLNVRLRKVIYWEHFGMMDNPEYCKSALEKMEVYDNNEYYLGDKLVVSFESSLKPINVKQVERIIKKYFI